MSPDESVVHETCGRVPQTRHHSLLTAAACQPPAQQVLSPGQQLIKINFKEMQPFLNVDKCGQWSVPLHLAIHI